MKHAIACAVIALTLGSPARSGADTHVRAEYHFSERYHHGSLQPGYELEYEWWIGAERISFVRQEYSNYEGYLLESAMRVTFDREKNRVIVVNWSDSTFTVVDIPTDPDAAVDTAFASALKDYRIDCSIGKTGETESAGTIPCAIYNISESVSFRGELFFERERRIMASSEVPFDWRLAADLFEFIRSFFNPGGACLAGIQKLEGFILASEDRRFSRGETLSSSLGTISIKEETPPPGIYGIPAGLERMERLDRAKLIGMRGILYQIGG